MKFCKLVQLMHTSIRLDGKSKVARPSFSSISSRTPIPSLGCFTIFHYHEELQVEILLLLLLSSLVVKLVYDMEVEGQVLHRGCGFAAPSLHSYLKKNHPKNQ